MGHGSLNTFMHHGILPFVGRERQHEQLLQFWNGTLDMQGLRALLLLGEAGTGKSRLILQIVTDVNSAGGIVIHTRLHPDISTSLAQLIGNSLQTTSQGRELLKSEPKATADTIAATLQRILRIRPTILIFEDIHFLSGDAVTEFTALLETLADENLAVLCVARPVEFPARAALDSFPMETTELHGLDQGAVVQLWNDLFGDTLPPDVLNILYESTRGNPLALRSALRSILKLHKSLPPEGTPFSFEPSALIRTIAENTRSFSQALSAHLVPSELASARRVSILGEVFAYPAAEALLKRTGASLEPLIDKGIIVRPLNSPLPLTGNSERSSPLAFNHTLLQKYFLDQAEVRADELLEMITAELPLYSVLPFELLRRQITTLSADRAMIHRGISHCLAAASTLDGTVRWETAWPIWETAQDLFEATRESWLPEERLQIEAELLHIRLAISRRNEGSPEFLALTEQLLELIDHPDSETLIRYRMLALTHLQRYAWRHDYSRCEWIAGQMADLIVQLPHLRFTKEYIFYLENVAGAALTYEETERIRELEREGEELLASPEIDEELRHAIRFRVYSHFIPVFESHEELERRFQLIAELEEEAESKGLGAYIATMKISVEESIGEADRMIETCDRMIPQFQEQGLFRSYYNCSLLRLCGYGAIGMDPEDLRMHVEALCDEAPPPVSTRLRRNAAVNVAGVCILRNAHALARDMAETMLESAAELPASARFVLAQDIESLMEIALALSQPTAPPLEQALASLALGSCCSIDGSIMAELNDLIAKPVLRYTDIIASLAVGAIFRRTEGRYPDSAIRSQLRSTLESAFPQILQWLAHRRLSGFLTGVLAQAAPFLSGSQEREWRGVATRLVEERGEEFAPQQHREGVRISVLGRITVTPTGGAPEIVRGARLRAVLGLLVAMEILGDEPAEVEFHRIAAPNARDTDHARKSVNMTIHGLRALIGSDAIITQETGPRLDLRYCSVDILEANTAISNVEEALRQGSLAVAYSRLSAALELTVGEVPFPALYDSLFESVRDEFENRLRLAVITVGDRLLRAGDLQRAEEILRRGFQALHGDEEILSLLCDALIRLGKRVEAERLRLSMSIGEGT